MAIEQGDVVKSVGRVFEVLELFDQRRAQLNATEVERHLGYPQSSTLALLKSMVALGYLSFDRLSRTYFPTIRIAMLGQWLEQSLYADNRLMALIDDVRATTGETVSISCENDLEMQFLKVFASNRLLTVNIKPGETVPLFGSVVGIAALARQTNKEIALAAERINRRTRPPARKIDLPAAMEQITLARKNGYSMSFTSFVETIGALAWVLPAQPGLRPIILSVAGPSANIREEKDMIVRNVRAALKVNGPDPAPLG